MVETEPEWSWVSPRAVLPSRTEGSLLFPAPFCHLLLPLVRKENWTGILKPTPVNSSPFKAPVLGLQLKQYIYLSSCLSGCPAPFLLCCLTDVRWQGASGGLGSRICFLTVAA